MGGSQWKMGKIRTRPPEALKPHMNLNKTTQGPLASANLVAITSEFRLSREMSTKVTRAHTTKTSQELFHLLPCLMLVGKELLAALAIGHCYSDWRKLLTDQSSYSPTDGAAANPWPVAIPKFTPRDSHGIDLSRGWTPSRAARTVSYTDAHEERSLF